MALEIFRLMGSVFVDTDKATKSLHKLDNDAGGFGKTLLRGVGTVAKWAAGVAVAAGTAGLAISKAALDSYAEFEQLEGGVKTLFGNSADEVMKYAQGAYKTAGMSANQYMETVTSFSASLLAGLKGDTSAAAKYADMAITDMSDNANKMGTSIEMIQNAYQGFAKQNYTMLDNLKLGYGGTKTEMQRLLKDADAINRSQGKITKYSLDNLNDVYEAIHVVQTEMGIAGTTALEATSTISGQIGMLKARFENFKNTLGESLAPVVKNILSKLIDNLPTIESLVSGLATTAVKVVDSAMPYITKALDFIEQWFSKVPEIMQKLKGKLTELGDYLTQTFQPAIEIVRNWFDKMREASGSVPEVLQFLKDSLQFLKDKAVEVGGYIASSFAPTIENLRDMFEAVRDRLQPLVDKLTEYVNSGKAAEDATNLMKAAGELLKTAFDEVAEAAAWVTEKVIEISNWCVEHHKTIENIAIVVASFAASWGLVNTALKIWEGLCIAGAIATNLLTLAGTGLTAVWAVLTSPITLVIAVIGALIAIGVLLWQNWDTIKAKVEELGQKISDKWNEMKASVVNSATALKDAAVNKFNELKNRVVEFATNLRDQAKEKFESMRSEISLTVSNAKQTVTETFQSIYSTVVDKVTSVYNKVKEKFDSIKTAISDAMETAKNTVSNVIETIKNLFDIDLKLNIKLPHISVHGGKAPYGIGGEGYLPSFSVDWYRKAMDNAMILDNPTLFGMNGAGQFLGAGEAGREVVVGEAHLLSMIGKVVAAQTAAQNDQVVAALRSILDAITGGNEELLQALLAGHTIKIGEREFARTVRAYA
jgi:phage-related protein